MTSSKLMLKITMHSCLTFEKMKRIEIFIDMINLYLNKNILIKLNLN